MDFCLALILYTRCSYFKCAPINIIKIKTNIIKSSANMDAEYESPMSNHSLKYPR